ncbi:uncharacterized protein LY89DRAFT_410453 [Mollisia scopiformis]|uniref:Uncharacterized protein n=1 Tax=Mollisia scopiformis TaxID=149040 RepID=A0A132B2M7_MOLSC|nr:uncharacterized protein LY89DRAFT_410453 [Mollisia scopiformis]KUJ06503.1 hypothetical protein LY89DRAFT_410453 [Mollisia scopiformis]
MTIPNRRSTLQTFSMSARAFVAFVLASRSYCHPAVVYTTKMLRVLLLSRAYEPEPHFTLVGGAFGASHCRDNITAKGAVDLGSACRNPRCTHSGIRLKSKASRRHLELRVVHHDKFMMNILRFNFFMYQLITWPDTSVPLTAAQYQEEP